MARVPQAKPRTVFTTPDATPYQKATGVNADAFGAAEGRAFEAVGANLDKLGGDLAKQAVDLQEEENLRKAKELDTAYARRLAAITSGDGTPENPGFYSTQGANAQESYSATIQQIKDARSELSQGVPEPVMRRFTAAADAREATELRGLGSHVQAQTRIAQDAASEGRINQAVSDMARKWTDDVSFEEGLKVIRGEVSAAGKRKGLDPDTQAKAMQAATGQALESALSAALASGDIERAGDLLKKHEGKVSGVHVAKLDKLFRTEVLATQAQTLAEEARARFPDDPAKARQYVSDVASGKEENEALRVLEGRLAASRGDEAYARAVRAEGRAEESFALQLEAATRAKVNFDAAKDSRERAETLRNNKASAFELIENGTPVNELPPGLKNALPVEYIMTLQRRSEQVASGAPPSTDWVAYRGYTTLTPEQLKGVDLGEARTRLGDTEFNQVRDLVLGARRATADYSRSFTPIQVINSAVGELGLGGVDNQEARGRLVSMFYEAVASEEQAKGRKLSDPELNAVVDGLTRDVVRKRSLGFIPLPASTKPFYAVEVPEAYRESIIRDWTQVYKKPPTEAEITSTYVLRKRAEERSDEEGN